MIEITEELLRPRREIERLLLEDDLKRLLQKAGMLHGHFCPGLALGIKAVHTGFKRLGICDNTGMEEIMAVVECNNCFIDGVQFASGCTLGNNALVYQDFGKTVATFYKRNTEKAVRLCVKSFELESESADEKSEGDSLFEKAVIHRESLSNGEKNRMKEIWIRRSFAVIETQPEQLFTIRATVPHSFAFAPIFDSCQCSVCNEKVMETKSLLKKGNPICIPCAKAEYRMVVGKGIVTGGVGD